MSLSTISMFCNSSGWLKTDVAATFGIPSIDWSNDKTDWAKARPMDDEERLLTQAMALKAANPASHVFVYRNLVKALPWMSTVREKLADPQYTGFFLKFKAGGAFPNGSYHVPNCDNNYSPPLCSEFYHDQEQSPAVPTPSNPNPDGSCVGTCDCGPYVPCGEYLFDHRNGSMLRDWLIKDVIGGPTSVGNPAVDGMFIDDFWCSNILNGSCGDPVQGPSEIDANSQADMGLSDTDILSITQEFLATMTAVQEWLLSVGKYTWSLIPGQENANASPVMLSKDSCAARVRAACSPASLWQTAPLMMGLTPGNSSAPLPYLTTEVAAFLAMRGPHAYLGWGTWGMSWPVGMTWNSNNTPVARPVEMDTEYGTPLGLCREAAAAGVFVRNYTHADVTVDCNSWSGQITMH